MSKTAKTLFFLEGLLVLLFIGLFGGVELNYITFNQIKYLIYIILIFNPIIAIKILNLGEGNAIPNMYKKYWYLSQ